MGPQELTRWHVLKLVLAGQLTRMQAAERVNLSYRQIKRLTAAVAKGGAAALLHGNRGQPSPRRLPEAVRARVRERVQGVYADGNDQPGWELLRARDSLVVSRETVRRLRRAAGQGPKRTRAPHVTIAAAPASPPVGS